MLKPSGWNTVTPRIVCTDTPVLTPYGDRRCMFDDRWGNTWQVANLDGR